MKKLTLVLLLVCLPLTAFALKVTSLYQVEVSIVSQTEDIKEQAIQEGFAQVLMKVSGDPNILDNPLIRANVRRADYYVQDYSFSSPSTSSSLYTIVINYSEPDVKRLLKKAGEQFWSDNRPLLLVWLAVTDQDNNTTIIDSESELNAFANMSHLGKKVGLPLIFPMMDVDDLSKVSDTDISNKSLDALNSAAQRYSPDGLLIGNVHVIDGGIDGDWELLVGDKKWDWSLTDASIEGMASGIVNIVSQTLAKYYVVKNPGNVVSFKMNIKNVTHRQDLLAVMDYIKQISSVRKVKVAQVTSDQVVLSVLSRGDVATVKNNMAINKKLIFKADESTQNKLIYEWA